MLLLTTLTDYAVLLGSLLPMLGLARLAYGGGIA